MNAVSLDSYYDMTSTAIGPPASLRLTYEQVISSVRLTSFFGVPESPEWTDGAVMTLPSCGRIRVRLKGGSPLTFSSVGDEFGTGD